MEIHPRLNPGAFEASFHAIDTHTVGEFTRIIVSGFPELKGDTMIERKNFLANCWDFRYNKNIDIGYSQLCSRKGGRGHDSCSAGSGCGSPCGFDSVGAGFGPHFGGRDFPPGAGGPPAGDGKKPGDSAEGALF